MVAWSSFQIGGCILINFICFFTLLFTILKPQFYDACLLTGLWAEVGQTLSPGRVANRVGNADQYEPEWGDFQSQHSVARWDNGLEEACSSERPRQHGPGRCIGPTFVGDWNRCETITALFPSLAREPPKCSWILISILLQGAIQVLRTMLFPWQLDPHPPPHNANNVEPYTFVTLFHGTFDTPPPPPSALRNTWMAPNTEGAILTISVKQDITPATWFWLISNHN